MWISATIWSDAPAASEGNRSGGDWWFVRAVRVEGLLVKMGWEQTRFLSERSRIRKSEVRGPARSWRWGDPCSLQSPLRGPGDPGGGVGSAVPPLTCHALLPLLSFLLTAHHCLTLSILCLVSPFAPTGPACPQVRGFCLVCTLVNPYHLEQC